ncbi:MAG TPA: hypothetical protein VFF63_04445 [Candidatus Babeliales bacterium]|nr:hypothetical protein [Candidatus Babeliales bacterium]
MQCYALRMPQLHDVAPLERSVEQAHRGLERFLIERRGDDGVARLRLHVPTSGPKTIYGISLDREVRVEACGTCAAGNSSAAIQISWMAEAMVFPRFKGTLCVRSEGHPARSYIELDGSYVPPSDETRTHFDATIGDEIAHATAREFLKDLKLAIEAT